jgi:hypothetical protein
MRFKEVIAVYSETYEAHKYKMQRYWLIKELVDAITSRS